MTASVTRTAETAGFVDESKAGKEALFTALDGLKNDTWSPLAETLYEAGAYFQGKPSPFNGISYTSPVQYYCQKNYVLIISDGVATKDSDSKFTSTVGDQDNDNKIELDDVAKYLYNIDMSGGQSLKKQNITTYTIGFSLTQPLLEDTAKNGAESTIMCGALRASALPFRSSSSSSRQVCILRRSGCSDQPDGEDDRWDRMYLAMFKPALKSFWGGNIKKYGIAMDKSGSVNVGDVLDANNSLSWILIIRSRTLPNRTGVQLPTGRCGERRSWRAPHREGFCEENLHQSRSKCGVERSKERLFCFERSDHSS